MSVLPKGGRPMNRWRLGAKLFRWPGEFEVTLFLGPLQIRLGNLQQAAWWTKPDFTFAELVNTGRRIRACREGLGG